MKLLGAESRPTGNTPGFPRLYAAASLKLSIGGYPVITNDRFPRLYAAASLKPDLHVAVRPLIKQFSAALCRGLIEASWRGPVRKGS